jgi:hypothetical protein
MGGGPSFVLNSSPQSPKLIDNKLTLGEVGAMRKRLTGNLSRFRKLTIISFLC